MIKGSDLLVSSLEEQNVKYIFGIPGNHILSIYDSLHSSNIKTILGAHEPGLGFMADGYGRVAREPGVALVTAGPGALNIVNPVAQAYVESSPMVVISSYCDVRKVGKGCYHELEHQHAQLNIFKEITKWQTQVTNASDIPNAVEKAFREANDGRKRPAYIEIPENVLDEVCERPKKTTASPLIASRPDIPKIREAAELIKSSKNPVIFAGGGIVSSGASKELLAFAESFGIPVATSAMGKNIFPESNPLSLGCGIGAIGSDVAREIIAESDLMIAVGTRFDEVGTGFFTLKVPETLIHIDVDKGEFNRNYKARLCIEGDAKDVLHLLNTELTTKKRNNEAHLRVERIKKLRERENESLIKAINDGENMLNPLEVVHTLMKTVSDDAILIGDAGNSSLWVLDYPMPGSQRVITPAAYNSMGFALPAAIGAKLAEPSKEVIAICGDGSFLMTGMELVTAVRYSLNITIVVLHDKRYNILCFFQNLKYHREHKDMLIESIDFKSFAESLGVFATKVESPKELLDSIDDAIGYKGPALVDAYIDSSKLPNISKRIQKILRG